LISDLLQKENMMWIMMKKKKEMLTVSTNWNEAKKEA
jgi:hypothetical protein